MFSLRSVARLAVAAMLVVGSVQARADTPATAEPPTAIHPVYYAARLDGGREIAAVDAGRFDPAYLRRRVAFPIGEAPGTIVIDTRARQLYLVEGGGRAIRYGIAVGREGFGWTGKGTIERNARWPRWTPPSAMIARDASLAKWAGGMPGGPRNPLGARALYIYVGGRDSLLRIHGTNEPSSIGRAASSGCFRMLNQDVIDLHSRVAKGTRVVVR